MNPSFSIADNASRLTDADFIGSFKGDDQPGEPLFQAMVASAESTSPLVHRLPIRCKLQQVVVIATHRSQPPFHAAM